MENLQNQKQRHGCLTAWLVLMMLVYTANMAYSVVLSFIVMTPMQMIIPKWIFFLLAAICILNVVFAIFIFRWKKWAFWGFLVTSLITMGINIYTGNGILSSLVGLFGVGILFALLQLRENGTSAWENLE